MKWAFKVRCPDPVPIRDTNSLGRTHSHSFESMPSCLHTHTNTQKTLSPATSPFDDLIIQTNPNTFHCGAEPHKPHPAQCCPLCNHATTSSHTYTQHAERVQASRLVLVGSDEWARNTVSVGSCIGGANTRPKLACPVWHKQTEGTWHKGACYMAPPTMPCSAGNAWLD